MESEEAGADEDASTMPTPQVDAAPMEASVAPASVFKRSWRFARWLSGGMSSFTTRMVWRSDTERVLDSLSKLEGVLKTRIQRRGRSWRWYARAIVLWSAALEVAFLSYAIYMTQSTELEWQRRSFIVLPVFATPACVVLLYKALAKYYRMRKRQDEQALEEVQQKMKQRLDEVKDKSNFYKTLEVIQKYDNDPVVKAAAATVLGSKLGLKADMPPELQAQIVPPGTPRGSPSGARSRRPSSAEPSKTVSFTPGVHDSPRARRSTEGGDTLQTFSEHFQMPLAPQYSMQHQSGGFIGMLERVAQMLVGEDPTQCYALICERCRQHNGLAKKEDMEVLVYHCRFCSHLNGTKDENIARKCRCYFCSQIRERTGQKLEGEAASDKSQVPRTNPQELTGAKDLDVDKQASKMGKVDGLRRRLDLGTERADRQRQEGASKGAIEEGWEDVISKAD